MVRQMQRLRMFEYFPAHGLQKEQNDFRYGLQRQMRLRRNGDGKTVRG